jgi:branched-chain amino acid transport system ATP-binding protein
MNAARPLLEVRDLVAGYGQIAVLTGVSFAVAGGESVAIVGGNGAGKTTLIRAVSGMLRPAGGQVIFAGREIAGWTTDRIGEAGLIHVPEGRQVFASLEVEENLRLGAILRRARPDAARQLERVYALFPRLAERRRQAAGTLSGGEQQMLAIGRALMARPILMMLDEPSLGLAPIMVEAMFEAITRLAREGMSLIVVEQNVAESLAICQRGYVLENGEVVLSGRSEALLADDRVRQAYLGI